MVDEECIVVGFGMGGFLFILWRLNLVVGVEMEDMGGGIVWLVFCNKGGGDMIGKFRMYSCC